MASRKPVVIEFRGQRGSGPDALMQVKVGRLARDGGVHAFRLGEEGRPAHLGRATFRSRYLTPARPSGERRFSQSVSLDILPPDPSESKEAVRRFKRTEKDGK